MSEQQPLVSIDVVPFRYSPDEGLLFALAERIFEPFLGELALPGVLLHAGESIEEAATRALRTKSDLPLGELVHVGAFDSTNRDPRGATISIALLSVQETEQVSSKAVWRKAEDYIAFSKENKLPFDHNSIVKQAYERLTQAIWNDIPVTRKLLGERFTTADALAVKSPTPHVSNASRWLKSWGPLVKIEQTSVKAAAGRPATTWSWKDEN